MSLDFARLPILDRSRWRASLAAVEVFGSWERPWPEAEPVYEVGVKARHGGVWSHWSQRIRSDVLDAANYDVWAVLEGEIAARFAFLSGQR